MTFRARNMAMCSSWKYFFTTIFTYMISCRKSISRNLIVFFYLACPIAVRTSHRFCDFCGRCAFMRRIRFATTFSNRKILNNMCRRGCCFLCSATGLSFNRCIHPLVDVNDTSLIVGNYIQPFFGCIKQYWHWFPQ